MNVAGNIAVVDKDTISRVQARLLELGYSGGGPADGNLDLKTQGSILNFRNRNNLPLKPAVDGELLGALESAPMIEIPAKQATATAADIAPHVDAVRKNWWAGIWTKILAVVSGLGWVVSGIIDNLGDAIDKLTPLKTFLSDYLSAVSPLTLVFLSTTFVSAVAFVILLQQSKAQKALVTGYQQGTVRNDLKEAPTP